MKFDSNSEKAFYDVLYSIAPKNPIVTHDLMRIVRNDATLFSFLPGVSSMAVCNSLALGNPQLGSDIDLFIVLNNKRFFIYRFLISFILQVSGKRRSKNKIKNRYCLSFFVADNKLDLADLLIENDVYFYFWFKSLIFLDTNKSFQSKFLEANKWFEKEEFGFKSEEVYKTNRLVKLFVRFLELPIFDFLESAMRKYSLGRIKLKNEALGNPYGVVAKEGVLKFHVKDLRTEVRDKFYRFCSK